MKSKLFVLMCIGTFLLINPSPAAAAAGGVHDTLPLCLPDVYDETPDECLALGPSAYLTEMAQQGLTFPLPTLPVRAPDPALSDVGFYYARVREISLRIFATAEHAAAGEPVMRTLRQGHNYVSYIDSRVIDGKRFYMIAPGAWVRPDDIAAGVQPPIFTGAEFLATPVHRFGWTIYGLYAQRQPGLQEVIFTQRYFERYSLVQVYGSRLVDGVEFLLVGPDEWLDGRHVGLVYPTATAPEGVTNGRWIEINLHEQSVAIYQDTQLVYATLISSGLPGWWTRPGLFQITEKLETTPMSGAFEADFADYYYLEDVPFTLYFDELRAFHGTYWHNSFGQQMSHGCANLSPGDSQWLYLWAEIGDWVYVWDPSGQTPTDPSLYGSGGA